MKSSPTRNDRYVELWQRILVRLTGALDQATDDAELDRLETLARELERAQRQGRLPSALVRKLAQEPLRASPRQA